MHLSRYKSSLTPTGIRLDGQLVVLEPVNLAIHGADFFETKSQEGGLSNWDYLPYGPFSDLTEYKRCLDNTAGENAPYFFAIISKIDNKAVGVANFLWIKPNDRNIEVGHINFSLLLQRTTEASKAMHLMMKWAFEAGYRRDEWKCNSKNLKSRQAA